MSAAHIGHCSCPLCGSKRAKLGLSAKGYAYMTCNACNCQLFARSDRSDEALRARHVPDSEQPPAAEPAPPAATKPPAAPPAPAAPSRPLWGLGAFT